MSGHILEKEKMDNICFLKYRSSLQTFRLRSKQISLEIENLYSKRILCLSYKQIIQNCKIKFVIIVKYFDIDLIKELKRRNYYLIYDVVDSRTEYVKIIEPYIDYWILYHSKNICNSLIIPHQWDEELDQMVFPKPKRIFEVGMLSSKIKVSKNFLSDLSKFPIKIRWIDWRKAQHQKYRQEYMLWLSKFPFQFASLDNSQIYCNPGTKVAVSSYFHIPIICNDHPSYKYLCGKNYPLMYKTNNVSSLKNIFSRAEDIFLQKEKYLKLQKRMKSISQRCSLKNISKKYFKLLLKIQKNVYD